MIPPWTAQIGRYRSAVRLAAAVLACAGWARASEATLGIGYDDVTGRHGSGALAIGVQLQADPFARLGPVGVGVGVAAETDAEADFWGGAGFTANLPLRRDFRLDASLMAGGYATGDRGDDLGSRIEFRTRVGISCPLRAPWRIGLALEHKSNADLAQSNPGIETLFVTLGRRF